MKHLNAISCSRPAKAQFEPILQLLGIFDFIINLPLALTGSAFGLLGTLGTGLSALFTAGGTLLAFIQSVKNPAP